MWNNRNVQWLVVAGLLILYAAVTSFYKVETAQQGVVTRFGAYHHISDEGPHFKLPFGIDEVYKIPVTRIHELQFGFRKESELSAELSRQESLMLTGDLNVAVVEWILQFRIADPKKFIFNAANVEKNIRDISISVMRRVVGDKLVSNVLTKDRVTIADTAKALTQEVLDHFDMGVLITKVNLLNVTPPEEVKPAFNEINIAKQEREQLINQAKGVYNKIIPEAEGKANRLVTEAEAYAVEIVNRAKGDSSKFSQVLAAYKTAPDITRKRMYLETMELVFSSISRFVVIDEKLKGILPVFGKALSPELVEPATTATATEPNEPVTKKKG